MKLFPVAVETMFVKFHFYLMVNYRKRFGNEVLQQETEFNVCMKSERASDDPESLAHFTFFRLLTNAQSNVVVK